MKGFTKIIIPLLVSAFVKSLTYETTVIEYNTVFTDSALNDKMKFYSMDLAVNSADMDLLVDAKIINSNTIYESPIVLVSTEPLPNQNKSKQWVCGQLGLETCLIPSSSLKSASKVFFGVVCNSCKFTLNSYFISEPTLKNGESQIFHLKKYDKIIFKLEAAEFFQNDKSPITIKSFNLRMTPYKMQVEIIDKNQPDKVLSAPINANWIGGQQAIIKPDPELRSEAFIYRIIFIAEKDGIFSIEAKTENSVSKLNDKILKFESARAEKSNCYVYNIAKEKVQEDLVFELKALKGNIIYSVYGNKDAKAILQGEVNAKDQAKIAVSANQRGSQVDGNWKVCVVNKDNDGKSALFALQAYLAGNHDHVKEYQKLLFNLLRNEEMYEIHNLQLKDKKDIPLIRMLTEVQAELDTANTNLLQADNSTNQPANNASANAEAQNASVTPLKAKDGEENVININGSGVSGIAVGFIFLITVLIGVQIMMAIFVNTKTIDEPLRMGRIEH